MAAAVTLAQRLTAGPPILLDGPTGTELQRRGVNLDGPGWSAVALETAPDVVSAIHRDYVAAGAEVLTANTFRTHARNLAAWGAAARARELTQRAVDLARAAADGASHRVWIAGSQAPLGDCYEPQQTPDAAALEREHRQMSQHLAAAGADLILVETHPTLREAVAATRAALSTGLPVITSFVCNRQGRLLSGEALDEGVQQLIQLPLLAVGVNCILAESAAAAIRSLQAAAGETPIGVYANVGYFTEAGGWCNAESTHPAVYARLADGWLDSGIRLIGGCCGTTPEHIRALRQLLDRRGGSQCRD